MSWNFLIFYLAKMTWSIGANSRLYEGVFGILSPADSFHEVWHGALSWWRVLFSFSLAWTMLCFWIVILEPYFVCCDYTIKEVMHFLKNTLETIFSVVSSVGTHRAQTRLSWSSLAKISWDAIFHIFCNFAYRKTSVNIYDVSHLTEKMSCPHSLNLNVHPKI